MKGTSDRTSLGVTLIPPFRPFGFRRMRKKQLHISIGPIEHVTTEKDRSYNELVCSVCHCEFDIELEGGIDGYIGILPVAFCSMCFAGMDEFFTHLHGCYDDEHKGYEDDN